MVSFAARRATRTAVTESRMHCARKITFRLAQGGRPKSVRKERITGRSYKTREAEIEKRRRGKCAVLVTIRRHRGGRQTVRSPTRAAVAQPSEDPEALSIPRANGVHGRSRRWSVASGPVVSGQWSVVSWSWPVASVYGVQALKFAADVIEQISKLKLELNTVTTGH